MSSPFSGFHAGLPLLELLILGAALVELRGYRFPLLVLPACVAAWVFVTDLKDTQDGDATAKLPTVSDLYVNAAPLPWYSDSKMKTKVKDLPANTRMNDPFVILITGASGTGNTTATEIYARLTTAGALRTGPQ